MSISHIAPCSIPACNICVSLAEVDSAIEHAKKSLVELSQKRRILVSRFNSVHDRWTSSLPTEILSQIFALYAKDSGSPTANKTPLNIGNVCKRWRDVSLMTSQLWTTVDTRADIDSVKPYDLDIAEEWLSRSRSLPLSLNIALKYVDFIYHQDNPILYIITLLRSHSSRWQNVIIDPFCEHAVAHLLFNNLDDLPLNLNCLDIRSSDGETREYNMDRLLLPTELCASAHSSTIGLAIGWERLTSIDIHESIHFDELIHMIAHAPILESCSVTWRVLRDKHVYPLPVSPVVHHRLRHLNTVSPADGYNTTLLRKLTLPSLKSLRYVYNCHSADDIDPILIHLFLERSSPDLDDFTFFIVPSGSMWHVEVWSLDVPVGITTLGFDSSQIDMATEIKEATATNNFISLLSTAIRKGLLPNLQNLVLNTSLTFSIWYSLAKLLQDVDQTDNTRNLDLTSGGDFLKSVIVYHPGPWSEIPEVSMETSVFTRLVEMEKRGITVTMKYGDSSCPLSRTQLL